MNTSTYMPKGILFVLLLVVLKTQAQTKYIDKNGSLIFEASEKVFEPVKAKNESVTMILDVATNEIAALALIKGFRFKNSLMEEHFNENYIESEIYPKATLKGQLIDFDLSSLTENSSTVMLKGTLKLHGTSKSIEVPVQITKSNDIMLLVGSFSVTPQDFNIDIPTIVKNKIAKHIIITFQFKLTKP